MYLSARCASAKGSERAQGSRLKLELAAEEALHDKKGDRERGTVRTPTRCGGLCRAERWAARG